MSLSGVSKQSYLRHHIIPDCGSAFLLDVWTKVDLVDPSENPGRRFGSILLDDPRVALPDGCELVLLDSLHVSLPWVFRPPECALMLTLPVLRP